MTKKTRYLAIIDDALYVTTGKTPSSFAALDYDWDDFRQEFHAIDGGSRFVIDEPLWKFLEHFCKRELQKGSFAAAAGGLNSN